MINFDDVTKENIKENNTNWSEGPDHPYGILIIGSSAPAKSKSLFNLKNQQQVIDKIDLYSKDPYEVKYQFVIDKQKNTRLKYFNDSKAFIEYSGDMDYI